MKRRWAWLISDGTCELIVSDSDDIEFFKFYNWSFKRIMILG